MILCFKFCLNVIITLFLAHLIVTKSDLWAGKDFSPPPPKKTKVWLFGALYYRFCGMQPRAQNTLGNFHFCHLTLPLNIVPCHAMWIIFISTQLVY